MKRQLYVLIGLLLFSGFVSGQTGTLKGTVVGEENGTKVALPMVKVKELEEGKFSYSSDAGAFQFELNPGKHRIVFATVGYLMDTIEVNVAAGETQEVEFKLRSNTTFEVVDIVVGHVDGSEADVVADVKDDDKVTNQMSEAQMESKGVGTVGEATKKITGLSMVGSVLYVRGLGDRYNVAYLNGLPLPSPDPDFRVVPLGIFPTDVVSSVQVSKVMSSELYGDFAGGAFNITTKSFYEDPTFKISLGTGMNSQTTFKDFRTYQGGKFDYFGFDDGTRDIPDYVLNNSSQAAYQEINSIYPGSLYNSVEGKTTGFHDNFGTFMKKALPNTNFSITGGTFIPMTKSKSNSKGFGYLALVSHDNNYNYSYGAIRNINAQSEERLSYDIEKYNITTTTTALFNTYFRFNPNNNISLNVLYVNTSDDETRESWGSHYDYSREIYSRRLTYRQNFLLTNQVIGTHKLFVHKEDQNFSRLVVDWRASYSMTGSKEPDRRQFVAFYDEGQKEDTEHYTFMYIDRNENHIFHSMLRENEIAAKFSGEYVLLLEEQKDSSGRLTVVDKITLRGGVDYKSKYREFDYKQYNYVINQLAANTVDNVNIYDINSYFNSEVHDNGEFYIQEVANFGSSYIAMLDVTSFYGDAKFRFKKLEIIPGVRYENSFQSVVNRNQQSPSEIEKTVVSGGALLPSLITKYSLSDKDVFRLVASKTLTRPKFNELAPFQYTLFFAGAKAQGNPDLENSSNYNVDLRYERYPRMGEMITLGGFYKYIDRPIEQTMLATASGQLMSYSNAKSATVAGFELEYVRSLSFLAQKENRDSTFLKDFSLGFNAAYIFTSVMIDTTDLKSINTNSIRPLEGASPYLVNFDIRYEKKFWISDTTYRKVMLAFAYNVFGPRLYSVGSNGIGDQYALPVSTLNFVARVELANRITLGLKAKNLLNPDIRIVQEDKVLGGMRDVSNYKRGIDLSFSIGYRF